MQGGKGVRAECIFMENQYFQTLAGLCTSWLTRADQKKGKLLTENSSWKSNKLQTARK